MIQLFYLVQYGPHSCSFLLNGRWLKLYVDWNVSRSLNLETTPSLNGYSSCRGWNVFSI